MTARSKRTLLFTLFYAAIILMMLFMFFYVQSNYGYEKSHPVSSTDSILSDTSCFPPTETSHEFLTNS